MYDSHHDWGFPVSSLGIQDAQSVMMVYSMNIHALGLCVLLLVGGCASDRRDPIFNWQGLHEKELLEMMGPPTERVSLSGGKVQLIFDHGPLDQRAGTHESWTCRMYFETDSRGFIQRVTSSGC